MSRKAYIILLIAAAFCFSCQNSETEQAAQLVLSNEKYALDKFVNGFWEGKCNGKESDKVVINFQKNAEVRFTYFAPGMIDFGSSYEQGLYEIIDGNTIKLYYLFIGEVIKVDKLDDKTIKLNGNENSIIYGCTFVKIGN